MAPHVFLESFQGIVIMVILKDGKNDVEQGLVQFFGHKAAL